MTQPRNPYSEWIRTCYIGIFLSPLGILPFLLELGPKYQPSFALLVLVGSISTTVLLLSLIALPIFYFNGHKELKAVKDLLAGNYWYHWRYSANEWQHFAESEWARRRREVRWTTLQLMAFPLLVGLIIGLSEGSLMQGLRLCAVLSVPMGLLIAALGYGVQFATYRRRLQSEAEIYIGSQALYEGNRYHTWKGVDLHTGKLEPGDPSVLRFRIVRSGKISFRSSEFRVAVPRGLELEARQLIQRLTAGS